MVKHDGSNVMSILLQNVTKEPTNSCFTQLEEPPVSCMEKSCGKRYGFKWQYRNDIKFETVGAIIFDDQLYESSDRRGESRLNVFKAGAAVKDLILKVLFQFF